MDDLLSLFSFEPFLTPVEHGNKEHAWGKDKLCMRNMQTKVTQKERNRALRFRRLSVCGSFL
jgi:hypothetical protein